jgi:hypothetical protein
VVDCKSNDKGSNPFLAFGIQDTGIPTFNKMYLVVLFLPLYSSIICGLFGRFLGANGSRFLSTTCLFLSFFTACFIFFPLLRS